MRWCMDSLVVFLHLVTSAWMLSCYFNCISTTICWFVDAPRTLSHSLLISHSLLNTLYFFETSAWHGPGTICYWWHFDVRWFHWISEVFVSCAVLEGIFLCTSSAVEGYSPHCFYLEGCKKADWGVKFYLVCKHLYICSISFDGSCQDILPSKALIPAEVPWCEASLG